ncbi:MAG: carboxypeptidase regulatory-like domain-containing protein [Chlamydiota bacterium]
MLAQTTVGTGSIVGTATDPSGAVVRGAKVAITNVATGQVVSTATNSSGAYNSGALVPGNYKVQVSAKGFSSVSLPVTVLLGNTSTANAKLQIGQESQVVEVQASEVQVNTEQPTVQGVLNAQQIENLPVNGRNFLDLAQLEPGVQIQDGQNFDPTKAGYSSISFGGRFGRTARIEVDGVDVSDETVGTTTTDIPASAIQEFQISQSSLDMSSELTSSGAVNVTTRSGTNAYHGEAFGGFRDSSTAAKLPTPPGFDAPFQRSQYGGRFGGPIQKDKMFYFLDGERTVQHSQVPVPVATPFESSAGTFASAFRAGSLLGKLDYQLTKNAHAFYRFTYYKSVLGANFGYGFSLYDTKNITRDHVVGVDFTTGTFTHAVRFSYLKFQNQIADATTGSSLPFANLGLEIFMGNSGFIAGPNLLAPQSTPQSNRQIRYDGSKPLGSHIVRFGISYNHIQGGGFASFFKNAPAVFVNGDSGEIAAAASGPFPGGAANPLNYPADFILMGNGLGFATTKPSFQFPAGGLGPDNRILTYLGDSWKIKPNFTLTYGLRYQRDTGRTDSELPAIPALNQLFPGLGNPVRQPNTNLAPQIGFAWDPTGGGKTSIRGGIGLFFENAVWNNVLFDGPPREATGAFLVYLPPCAAPGLASGLPIPGGQLNAGPDVCGTSAGPPLIGNSAAAIAALQKQWQALTPVDLNAPNPNYTQTNLTNCPQGNGCFFPTGASMFDPNYRSPRSVQMNIGIQREIRPGMIISADYIRNVQTHFLLGVDVNHAGDIHYFNMGGAQAAINDTNAAFGCPAGSAGIDCAIAAGASIADYAGNGLGSSDDMGGSSCLVALGRPCAFGGINPAAPPLGFLEPIGRSVYNGLQVKWTENVQRPFRGVRGLNFQVSYALSRFENSGGGANAGSSITASRSDQDFIIPALDNSQPNRYFGPSVLDRTHQLSFGGYAQLPGGLEFSIMSHFYSPLSITPTVSDTFSAGQIFMTDFTGDGTTQDPLPGTHVGSFDRGLNASGLSNAISAFNGTVNQVTPAGQVLVSNNLFTLAQMQALGGTINGGAPLIAPPAGQVNLDWLRAFDMTLSWNYTIKEKLTVRPSIGFYNLMNFANFDLPGSMLSGLLTGAPGTINGTNYADHFSNRAGAGTGLNSLGTPRQIEFGLRVSF